MKQRNTPPVAIVGLGALFPGSTHAGAFWRNILEGNDLIGDVPSQRWRLDDYFDEDQTLPGKTYARRGAFLDSVPFDPLEFGVPPKVVPATDTSQLLALIVAQQVLDDASNGQFETLDRDRMSVILGVTAGQELMNEMASSLERPVWQKALREVGLPESEVQQACDRIAAHYVDWQESTFPGLLGNVVAGRIANRFDLGGTNCVTDAACASAFSAMQMAINELYLGDSDLVIAGGVDTFNDIFMYMCFSKTPALSPTGDCRPFSDRADGTLLGEGMAMFALKRLDDAERDGDKIYAVVRGIGSSSDGRSKSIYAPLASGQAKALTRAYENAGYGADTVELVEAHGTGTRAGDAAEFGGLRSVFEATGREDRQWCALGSVKSQIGHTKAAAGAAGLFKTVMALHHKVLPPTLKVDRPNPKLDIEASAFYLSTYSRPWLRGSDHPRRAGVSAFGFGGSNFHVTVEEYTGDGVAERVQPWRAELLLASGADAESVAATCRAWIEELAEGRPLSRIARDSHQNFDAGSAARLAVVADPGEARKRLTQAIDLVGNQPDVSASLPTGIEWGVGRVEGDVAFLFPGQGSQRIEMGCDLAIAFDDARTTWDELATEPLDGTTRLADVVFPPPAYDDEKRAEQLERLTHTEWAQPALGVASLATLALLEKAGVSAKHFAGHSFGEVVALSAAGRFSRSDAIRIARKRGELMAKAAELPGSMTAVQAPPEQIRPILEEADSSVVIANENGPRQTVLSGETEAIEAIEAKLEEARLPFRRLNVATAFHSPVVAESTEPFRAFLDEIEVGPGEGTVWSNAEAAPYGDDLVGTLSSAIAKPVKFADEISAIYQAGASTFVEVGPGSILTRIASRIVPDATVVATDSRDRDGVRQLWHTFATLAARGVEFDLTPFWRPFALETDPRELPAPKMTIPIAGGNVGKPYPPADPAELPKPNPPRPAPVAAAPESTMSQDDNSNPPQSRPAPSRQPERPTPRGPGSGDAWLRAFEEGQRQLAEAHSSYHRAMADSHVAFLRAVETSQSTLAAMMTGQAAPGPAPEAQPPSYQPAPRETYAPAPETAPPTPTPRSDTTPRAARPTAAPQPRRESVAAPTARAPEQAAPVAKPDTKPAAKPASDASASLESVLMEAVADKTGYPAEMLTLEMKLEADLGIDSIKRVEILSAVNEALPELPEVDGTRMAELTTLGEILAFMQAELGDTGTAPAASHLPPQGPPTAPAPTNGVAIDRDIRGVLLDSVADKTGYPAEMLTLEMKLEADLGIDSIKRVEILSAVNEALPELPEVDAARMAELNTLGEILDFMEGASAEKKKLAATG